jgi:hypothetical protein
MVYLALTRRSYDTLIAQLGATPSPLWVNQGVLSTTELSKLREAGVDLSHFTRFIDPNNATEIEEAIFTVQEHHPDQKVRVV